LKGRRHSLSEHRRSFDRAAITRPIVIKTIWAVTTVVVTIGWVIALVWGAAWIAQYLST
jgi:hypothetical protein